MRSKLRRVGNSLGVLIPAEICTALDLKEGDAIEISLDADRMIIRFADDKSDRRSDFIRSMEEVFDEDAEALAKLSQ